MSQASENLQKHYDYYRELPDTDEGDFVIIAIAVMSAGLAILETLDDIGNTLRIIADPAPAQTAHKPEGGCPHCGHVPHWTDQNE